jgi:hypothetical protein
MDSSLLESSAAPCRTSSPWCMRRRQKAPRRSTSPWRARRPWTKPRRSSSSWRVATERRHAARCRRGARVSLTESTIALFAWLISHQPAVLFSHNKPATSNQSAVLFSQNKPAPAISHQPTEQAACLSSSLQPRPRTRSPARASTPGTRSPRAKRKKRHDAKSPKTRDENKILTTTTRPNKKSA